MRSLTRSITIKAPSSFALAYMHTYFLQRGHQSSGAELALRFPLPAFPFEGLTLEKRALVHVKYSTGHGGRAPLTIGWQPTGKGPFPSFTGSLTATDETESTCRLTITGSYTPPGGIAGTIFDHLIGVRIANATISALLDQFQRAIEADYAVRLVP